ncbi:MAG: hypothetical protein ACYTEO_12740 [Planctomycetota bacterium]
MASFDRFPGQFEGAFEQKNKKKGRQLVVWECKAKDQNSAFLIDFPRLIVESVIRYN